MKDKKPHKKSMVGSIVFYIITACLLFFIAVNIISPDNVVNMTGFQVSVVPTPSMKPNINRGDMIILTKVDQDDVKVNDIVVYYNYIYVLGGYRYERVVHRVISATDVDGEMHYVTQGDNPETNPSPDVLRDANGNVISTYLTSDLFIAKVPQIGVNHWALRIPVIGYIVLFFQWLVRLLVANPILLLLVVVNVGIIVALIVVLRKGSKDRKLAGIKEEKKRIKANDVSTDKEHKRDDDEEDGSA